MLGFFSAFQVGTIICCLLVAAAVLALLTLIIKEVFSALAGKGGTFYIVMGVVLIPSFYKVSELCSEWMDVDRIRDSFIAMHSKRGEQFGVISIFRKERIRLYQYYEELSQRRQQCDIYIRELKAKRHELKSEQAQATLTQEIRNIEAESEKLDDILCSIEDVAGRIYFSRFMKNLGANTDTSELDGEMDSIQQQSEQVIRTQLKAKK